MTANLKEKQVSALTVVISTAVATALAGGGTAAGTAQVMRGPVLDDIRSTVRQEMDERLKPYLTREEAATVRFTERERFEGKLDGIKEELVRLRVAVERNQK